VLLGEQHAAVDDQELAAVLEDGHVPADLTEPAEADDAKPSARKIGGSGEFGVRVTHDLTLPEAGRLSPTRT
jgi:hypothetical protein